MSPLQESALAHLITELTLTGLRANPQLAARPDGIVWQRNYPNIQGKGEDDKNKNYFKGLADAQAIKSETAIKTASEVPELEQRRRDRVMAIDKWDTGESGPKDIRNLPGADTSIALFKDAQVAHDAGRRGRGINTMTDGVNPAFGLALEKQNEMERDLAGKGALEGHVNDILEGNKAEMYGLSGADTSRRMQVAGMRDADYNNAVGNYLRAASTFRQPNFFRQLAMQFAQGSGQGTAMLAGG